MPRPVPPSAANDLQARGRSLGASSANHHAARRDAPRFARAAARFRREASGYAGAVVTARRGARRLPFYRDLVLISGVLLVVLGIGNWVTGATHLRAHPTGAARARPVVAEGSREVEAAISAEVEVARVRMDFYHVVASGGRLMTAAGIAFLAFGLARRLRAEARWT